MEDLKRPLNKCLVTWSNIKMEAGVSSSPRLLRSPLVSAPPHEFVHGQSGLLGQASAPWRIPALNPGVLQNEIQIPCEP